MAPANRAIVQPWFDDRADALRWIRQTAEGIVDGSVDPHWGANHIWSTALGLNDVGPLRSFIDAGDRLDYSDRLQPEEIDELTKRVIDAARSLLANDSFWSQLD